jgi:Flp pilus assembly pilin Flp
MIQRVAGLEIWKDRRGQDLVEYALMAGFVALVTGAVIPEVAGSLGAVLSKINALIISAANNPVSHFI